MGSSPVTLDGSPLKAQASTQNLIRASATVSESFVASRSLRRLADSGGGALAIWTGSAFLVAVTICCVVFVCVILYRLITNKDDSVHYIKKVHPKPPAQGSVQVQVHLQQSSPGPGGAGVGKLVVSGPPPGIKKSKGEDDEYTNDELEQIACQQMTIDEEDWERKFDPTTGKHYLYNKATGKTRPCV